jgi:hypothetical protein
MATHFTLSQAFNGMILEKRANGHSPHTTADYLNTLKKFLDYLGDDPPFTSIKRSDIVAFMAYLDDCEVTPGGIASRGTFKLSAKARRDIHTNLSALWT